MEDPFMETTVKQAALMARTASIIMAATTTGDKNKALEQIAQDLSSNRDQILAANATDTKKAYEDGLAEPLIKRLVFTENKLNDVANGVNFLMLMVI